MVRKKFFLTAVRSAKYMNNLLKEMSVQAEDAEGVVREVSGGLAFSVTKGLTSRSLRNGPCTEVSLHPGIDVSYIVPRGNWTVSRIHTVFR